MKRLTTASTFLKYYKKLYVMLKFLSLLIVLQIFQGPASTQDINQRNYQPNVGLANNPYWPYQAIKSNIENHQHRRLKPCLSQRKSHVTNQGSSNEEWVPTLKVTVTKPALKGFISQSLKEKDKVEKHNNGLSGTDNEELTFGKKLNTPAFISSVQSSSANEDDCVAKSDNQDLFRRSMPDSVETVEKQIDLHSSQVEETSSRVHVAEISDKCNEEDTKLNSRRSNSDNENVLHVVNEKNNKTKEKNIVQNDENYVTRSSDSNEERNYNARSNDKQDQRNGYGITKMAESSVILMQNSRTCYACSSAGDPSCWHPSRKTTVKYCRKGHDACITRTFTSSYGLVLIRDCGRSCEDVSFPGVTPNYKSCSICHYDLCNNAYSVKSHFIIYIIFLLTVSKYSL